MATYNVYTGQWQKFAMPSIDDIKAIVGEQTPIEIDSDGNITVDKDLSNDEMTALENFSNAGTASAIAMTSVRVKQ